MKKILLFCILLLSAVITFAQKEIFDLTTYTAPKNWEKDINENVITYSFTDKKKKTWCQVGIYKSTISKGSIEQDFDSEWEELIKKPNNKEPQDAGNAVKEIGAWKIKTGRGKFTFSNTQPIAVLTTLSGYNRCVSIVATTNSLDYMPAIEKLLASVEMKNLSTDNPVNQPAIQPILQPTIQPTGNSKFAFTSTNFDDGWTSTIQNDWIEVTKGTIKVLLHFPKEGTIFPADPDVLTNAAWNILVAPRYKDLKNYKTAYISTYDRPYLGMGNATEITTGKNVFIVFFRQGQSGWLEFVAPDKNSFIQQYKFDPEAIKWDSESSLMNPLAQMVNYNKFAIAAGDFKGSWSSDFTGVQQLYNIYTGNYAGMNINQSNEEFVFNDGNTYNWKLLVVNGMVGNMKYAEVKSSGKFNIPNNWQIHFTKIESGAKTFHAFWSCIKGARILNLLDAVSPDSGIYTKYGLAK